jgi:hypothetical protein
MKAMLTRYQNGEIQLPQITNYSSSDFAQAHEALGKGQTAGKIVVSWA